MSDIMAAIGGFLGMTWNFLMHTYIPGTEISFGVMFVGFAIISIGFHFLSLAVGVNIGEADVPSVPWGKPNNPTTGLTIRVNELRKNDSR